MTSPVLVRSHNSVGSLSWQQFQIQNDLMRHIGLTFALILLMPGCAQIAAVQPQPDLALHPPETGLASSFNETSLPTATVISVGDGDTLRVSLNGTPTTIRLACIDAPEKAQPEGNASADRLKALLPRDTAVTIRKVSGDQYGRTIAEVYLSNRSINTQLVAEGRAVVYPAFLDGCPDSRTALLNGEQTAKAARLGIWGSDGFVMPWQWRRTHH